LTQTPIPAAPSLPAGSDTGISDSDGITDIALPTLVGKSLPGAAITVYDNDFNPTSIVGTGTADANGNYDIVLSQALNDGKNSLTVTAQAPDDTVSQHSAALFITVDTSPPDLPTAPLLLAADDSGPSAQDGVTSKNILHLTGFSEPGATVFLYNVALYGTKDDNFAAPSGGALASAVVGQDGAYTITTGTLPDGTYKFGVIAEDIAGNFTQKFTKDSPIVYTTITVDTAAPAAPPAPTLSPGSDTGSLRTDGLTSVDTPTVTGTAEANATVELFDGTSMVGTATADKNGAYAITASMLDEGPHTLTVKAVDQAGNISDASAPLNMVVDATAPTGTIMPLEVPIFGSIAFTLNFSEPVTGLTARALQVVTSGGASGEIASVTGSGSTWTVTVEGLTGAGTVSLALADGTHVTDLAGNPASISQSEYYTLPGGNARQPAVVATLSANATTDLKLATSASGRLVAFDTSDSLVNGAGTAGNNVYVKDMSTGALTLVSTGLGGTPSNGTSGYPSLSDDGRTIAFISNATNLVAGGPTDGSNNVYVAHLTPSANGQSLTVSGVTLVSTGNGEHGVGNVSQGYSSPALSGDGEHVAFVSDQALMAGVVPGYNVYEQNLQTGSLTLVSAGTDGTGGSLGGPSIVGEAFSVYPSISYDGSRIAYESDAQNLISTAPFVFSARNYVYDAATGSTTEFYGADQLGIIPNSFGDGNINDDRPQISSNGTWLTYGIFQDDPDIAAPPSHFLVQQNVENPSVPLQVLTSQALDSEAESASVSSDGRYVSYLSINYASGSYVATLLDTISKTTTPIASVAVQLVQTPTTGGLDATANPVLTDDGNAVAYTSGPLVGGGSQIVLDSLVPVVGVEPVGNDDRFDAAAWHEVQMDGLLVSGTSNEPDGAKVLLNLTDSAGNALGTQLTAAVTGGVWSTTIPGATLAPLGDGTYTLSAVVDGPEGASLPAGPAFTVDTVAPDTPDAPKLDANSDTSPAGDGSATSQDTPTVTGLAEAGATITLYDANSPTPDSPIDTTTADSNGVYAVAPEMPLSDGTHIVEVTATDAAGNVSALSTGDTFVVDTMPPDAPNAPALAVGSDTGADITDHITNSTSPTLTGLAEAKSLITLYDTDGISVLGTGTASASGTYSITPDNALSVGVHDLTVTATNAAGNASPHSAAETITIDTLPPLMPVITTVSGVIVDGGSLGPLVEVDGTAEPGSTVMLQLDGGSTDLGVATVGADGDYAIDSEALPAGAHMLSVVATDVAGNASQPSLQTAVTIANIGGIPPAGSITGVAEDGLLVGSTVFADANNNGILDPGEASSTTDTLGVWTLNTNEQLPPLVAMGGTDSETGLVLPGELDAPAGATQINPLTTLLAHLSKVSGTPVTAALIAVENQALGLDAGTDLLHIDPIALANGSSPDASVLAASTKVMDTAVTLADVISAQTGATRANAFSAAFDAIARAAMAASSTITPALRADSARPTLNLDNPNTLQAIAADAAGAAVPGAVLPDDVLTALGTLLNQANGDLDTTTDPNTGVTGEAYIDAVARVAQAQAAPALAEAGSSAAALTDVLNTYVYSVTGGFGNLAASENAILAAPSLAAGQDTGASDSDNVTMLTSPILTGIAPPGSTVAIELVQTTHGPVNTIVGTGVADAQGNYAIKATLPPGYDTVVAIQLPAGETLSIGTTLQLSNIPGASETLLTIGDLPGQTGPLTPPTINDIWYVSGSGNDADHAALYVDGNGAFANEAASFTLTADGNPTPIGTAEGNGAFGITTLPLANGTHTLVVTETFLDGETVQSAPTTLVVASPGYTTLQASAAGDIAGGRAFIAEYGSFNSGIVYEADDRLASYATSGGSGALTLPLITNVYGTGGFGNGPVLLHGGVDTATGLSVPDLLAPLGSGVITPSTTLLMAEIDVQFQPSQPVTPTLIASLKADITAALGLPASVDLENADALGMAEQGDPALLLKNIEILNTAELLAPFVVNPFLTMARTTGETSQPIDFTSAAQILLQLTTYNSTPIFGNNDTTFYASVLPDVADIIAASNAAIEAHAAGSTDPADIISYALAVERLVQTSEAQALDGPAIDISETEQDADFDALKAEYTGASLDTLIAGALSRTVQVKSFTPDSASTDAGITDFTLHFTAPVTNLNADDFTVSSSSGLIGAAVSAVTPVAGSDGTAYIVAVSTGVGQGTLALHLAPDGIDGAGGRPLTSGLFAQSTAYAGPALDTPSSITVADLNWDGKPDILASVPGNFGDSGLTVYLGQGDGTFLVQPEISDGLQRTTGALTGDFNGDGKADAISFAAAGVLSVQLGNGTGSFGAPILTDISAPGTSVDSIATGDFNGDGKLDVAVLDAEPGGDGMVQIYQGNGDGTFTPEAPFDAGGPAGASFFGLPDGLVATDLNGDGKTDLVVDTTSGPLSVFLGDGHGGFTLADQPAVPQELDGGPLAVGDLNGDGVPDIVSTQFYPPPGAGDGTSPPPVTVSVLLGRGDGTFAPAISVPLPVHGQPGNVFNGDGTTNIVAVAIGDVTGDGVPDIVLQTHGAGEIVLPGTGGGSFGAGYFVEPGGAKTNSSPLALADLNGDGRLDMVTGGLAAGAGNNGIAVSLNDAQTILPASASTIIDRAAIADPILQLANGPGTLSHVGTAYTLDLGMLSQNASVASTFALANAAAAPADGFDGIFGTPSGSGFSISGASLPDAVAAGGSTTGLTFAADTGSLGSHSETLVFAPRDISTGGTSGLELAPITLTVLDAVVTGTALPPASLGPLPSAIVLPNTRVGGADTQALAVTNAAASGAATLDVGLAASGDASASGSVTGLAPQATDSTDLTVGVDGSQAGLQAGTVTVSPLSDQGGVTTPLPAVAIPVSGAVYRTAAAGVLAHGTIVHVGDPGTIALSVTNTAPADGYSENLDAAISAVSGDLANESTGNTATVAAGATDASTLDVGVSTAQAGTISGTATLALASDGGTGAGSLDGLGTLTLATDAVAVSVTVDNYAAAALADSAGGGNLQQVSGGYTLDLGTLLQGASAPVIDIAALNTATGPADALSGSFAIAGAAGVVTDGFGGVAGIAAAGSAGAGTISLSTSTAGTFSKTIVFDPKGSNSSGYSENLAPETLTVLGVVQSNAATLTPAMATIQTKLPIDFGKLHLGQSATDTLSIANTATPPGALLDASIDGLSGNATASGSITQLAAGATDSADVRVGLDTSMAGARSGVASLAFLSESGGTTQALPDQNVNVSGDVFREAAATIAPVSEIVHVGDPGSVALSIGNSAPDDGYSENLLASLAGVTGAFGEASAGPTGEIAPGSNDKRTLALSFSTATAGTLSGSARVTLTSDGGIGVGSLDGLGETALPAETVPLSVTVDHYASAALQSDGALTATGNGTYTLDLGSTTQGAAALSADLTATNAANGPADWLNGAFIISGDSSYTNSGFGTFSKLAAGAATNAGTVSLSTARAGSFSETLTLDPTGGNASGFSAALGADTVIITGKIAAPTGIAHGDVHMVTFDGLHYDFQATGDFVLARATDPANAYQIQIHTSTLRGIAGISYTTQIAAELGGGQRVNFGAAGGPVVWVDGQADTMLGIGASQTLDDGSVLLRISSNSYKLIWHTGETLDVTDRGAFFDLSAALSPADRPGSVQGLLGSDTGQATDFSLPDGTVLAQPVATSVVLSSFADAWRVDPQQSLLANATPMPVASAPIRFMAPDVDAQSAFPGASAMARSGSTNGLGRWQDLTQSTPLISSFVPADVSRPTGWDYDEICHMYIGAPLIATTQTHDVGAHALSTVDSPMFHS
jgi:hypothetical protein